MKNATAIAATAIASLLGSAGLLGLTSATPAGASLPVTVSPTVISAALLDHPGAYVEIVYQLNSEGVPAIAIEQGQIVVTILDVPGAYLVVYY